MKWRAEKAARSMSLASASAREVAETVKAVNRKTGMVRMIVVAQLGMDLGCSQEVCF